MGGALSSRARRLKKIFNWSQEATVNRYRIWAAFLAGMMILGSTMSVQADIADVEVEKRIETQASIATGYRGTSVHGTPGRAREYDSLKSSPLFDAKLFFDQERYHLDLKLDYVNDEDYSSVAHIDTKGLLMLDLRSDRFFHNLDHIPYADRSSASLGTSPRFDFSDMSPDATYGLRLDFSEAKAKVKCPDYPAHFNISYWRFEKEGDRQQRFVDENCAGACHMQSKSREIDYVTEEVKASVDAHAGLIDIVLETLFRAFRDHEPIPADDFDSHNRGRDAGVYENSENPESRLKEITLRLNTAPSGGLVGSASFTLGERENRSDLTSVAPVDSETDYYKTAADVTYTPSQNWTFNLRYRFLDMDSDNTSMIYDTVSGGDAFKSPVAVRESMDVTRSWYEAMANYRPSNRLTLKGEFRREEIDRSNTGEPIAHSSSTTPITINPTWQLPDEEVITRVKLGFSSRLLEKSALKLSGWVAVQQNDDPAYGTSYGDSQELFLSSNYTPSPFWGIQANINLLKQENDDYEIDGEIIDREKEQQTITFGTWIAPRENLSLDLYYGYFRTADRQQIMFFLVLVIRFVPTTNRRFRQLPLA